MRILEHLLGSLRSVCAGFTDKRRGCAVTYSMLDIGMSGFAPFFMQCESFLSYQRGLEERHGRSNCQTLFGMAAIPTDNHIRSMLDEVSPAELQASFDDALDTLRAHGGCKSFERLGGRVLIALDGTEYFCSYQINCPHCLTRKRNNSLPSCSDTRGQTESYHTMLAATLVAPGHAMALPLMPEFIANTDGTEKQDCERNAVKRWLANHGPRLANLRPVYLGDALFACQPVAGAVLAAGGDFLFVCKPDGHKTLYDFIQGATLEEHKVTLKHPGNKHLTYHYRWIEAVPLRDSKDALNVNWIGVTITNATGKTTYNGAFVTSLAVTKDTVAELVACARARWKIENETFNVLKNNGYHLEHNFGHGKKNPRVGARGQALAMVFAAMNLLAFAFHTVCDSLEELWKTARTAKRSRTRFFEHIRTLAAYLIFPSWNTLMETLIAGKPPPELQKIIFG